MERKHVMVLQIRAWLIFILLMLPALALGSISELDSEDVRLAYIDPGAGSFMIQALVAAVAGIAVTARLYWSKIKSLLGLSTADDDDDREDDE